MINSISSCMSGLNTNAYATVTREKSGVDDASEPRNASQPEAYWTPERMRNVIPPDMGAMADSEVEGQKPEQSDLPEGVVPPETGQLIKSGAEPDSSNPNSYIENVNGIQLDDYWTPERMRNVIPPDMGAMPDEEVEGAEPDTPKPEATQVDLLWQYHHLLLSAFEQQSVNILI